jgi:hypothetical protein
VQNQQIKFVFTSEFQQPVKITPFIFDVEYTTDNFKKSVVPFWPIDNLFHFGKMEERIYKQYQQGKPEMFVDVTFDAFPKLQDLKFNQTAWGIMERIKIVIEAINEKYPIVYVSEQFMLYDNGEFREI